jgi:hypothetical protein
MFNREERLKAAALKAIQDVFASPDVKTCTASRMEELTGLPRARVQPIMVQLAKDKKLNAHPGDGELTYIASRAWLQSLPVRTPA